MRQGATPLVAGSGDWASQFGSAAAGTVQGGDHAGDDVVHIGEVALHLAVAEDVDRPAGEDRLGELEERHVRPAPGAVDREEPEPVEGCRTGGRRSAPWTSLASLVAA